MSVLNKITNYETIQVGQTEINRLGKALVKGMSMEQICQLVIYNVSTSYNMLTSYNINK